jgi:nucleotide-binding universal stress UspA family protein
VLNIFEEFEGSDGDYTVRSADLYDQTDTTQVVEDTATMREDAGPDQAVIRREHGNPAAKILVVAADIPANCIAISGRKRAPTGKLTFGSVTQSLLLAADRLVLTVMSG